MSKTKNSRLRLPNGCSATPPVVLPKNWRQAKKITGPWRIFYRFYDPNQEKPKQVNIKTMNQFTEVDHRKQATEIELEDTLRLLKAGYNPFLKKQVVVTQGKYDIAPTTLFPDALKRVVERLSLSEDYHRHFTGYVIPSMERAARALNLFTLPISEIRRRHIIFMLDWLKETNARFSDNTYNRFRTDLHILFKELTEIEATETNIITDMKVKEVEKKEKEILTHEQRVYVNALLLRKYPTFHRFFHIFYHAGGRIAELMRLQVKDVDLEQQEYKVETRKGKAKRTVYRTIKNVALPFWQSLLQGNPDPEAFVFSRGLKPGEKPIRKQQITQRWYRLIKQKEHEIGGEIQRITADFYHLKHLNTTEMIDFLTVKGMNLEAAEKMAAEHNTHTTTAMVRSIYDLKQRQRHHEQLKKVNNTFI